MNYVAGGIARRSDATTSTPHHRPGTSYYAQDPSRNKKPKRGNYSQCSWKKERYYLRVKETDL
jgi:hypothetical protein